MSRREIRASPCKSFGHLGQTVRDRGFGALSHEYLLCKTWLASPGPPGLRSIREWSNKTGSPDLRHWVNAVAGSRRMCQGRGWGCGARYVDAAAGAVAVASPDGCRGGGVGFICGLQLCFPIVPSARFFLRNGGAGSRQFRRTAVAGVQGLRRRGLAPGGCCCCWSASRLGFNDQKVLRRIRRPRVPDAQQPQVHRRKYSAKQSAKHGIGVVRGSLLLTSQRIGNWTDRGHPLSSGSLVATATTSCRE